MPNTSKKAQKRAIQVEETEQRYVMCFIFENFISPQMMQISKGVKNKTTQNHYHFSGRSCADECVHEIRLTKCYVLGREEPLQSW